LRAQESKHKIPAVLLCGKVWFESGFDPGAIGANGWDMGPAQINLSVHSHSVEDAVNPAFWIPWTTKRFVDAYNRYRTQTIGEQKAWDPAVLQHNWPVGADRWASTGRVPTHATMDARPEVVASKWNTWAEFYVGKVKEAGKLFG
jgi:hypothetical protein